jgi:hypothetical protein
LTQEADWVTDLGATWLRETLYHKMVEMAWKTKMMIGKVSSERENVRLENNKEHTKLLNEILSHLSSLETITKLLTKVEKDQKAKMERLVAQFHLYLCYVHHMDITLADGMERQHISERLGRSPKRRRTRARWMKERNISLSWTSVWLVYCQVSRVSLVLISASVIFFMYVVLIFVKNWIW